MKSFLKNFTKTIIVISFFISTLHIQDCFAKTKSPSTQVKEFTESFVVNVRDINTNPNFTTQQKHNKLADLVRETIDFDWISRFAVGIHWDNMNKEQKMTYLENYREFLIETYIPKFEDYTPDNFTIFNIIDIEDGEYIVEGEYKDPDNNDIPMDIQMFVRIYPDSEKLFFDIVGEGISFIQTQRSEIDSTIARKGVNHFLIELQNRVKNKT